MTFEEMTFEEILTHESRFQFQLLSRMQMDLKYYFGNGGKCKKYLWANTIRKQLEYVEKLVNHLKPEWFTLSEVQEYKSKIGEN